MHEEDHTRPDAPSGGVQFLTLYPDTPPPEPATPDIDGSLPVKAVRYCPPVVKASAFGWVIRSPASFALRWDGSHSEFSHVDADNKPQEWTHLEGGVEMFLPNAERLWDDVPEERREQLRTATGEPQVFKERGVVFINADPRIPQQLETHIGLIARTPPGWCMLMRGLPNWPYGGYQILEGIIETDWYRSLLPVMIRLTEPGRIVVFRRGSPMAMAQPVPRAAFDPGFLRDYTVTSGVAEFSNHDWAEFVEQRTRRMTAGRKGTYRDETSRRAQRDPQAPVRGR